MGSDVLGSHVRCTPTILRPEVLLGREIPAAGLVTQSATTMTTFRQELVSHLGLRTTVCLLLITGLGIAVQRLYFHRLSRFPGPKLAAATWWYMTYYEVWLNGGLVEHLEVLHAKYGTAPPAPFR